MSNFWGLFFKRGTLFPSSTQSGHGSRIRHHYRNLIATQKPTATLGSFVWLNVRSVVLGGFELFWGNFMVSPMSSHGNNILTSSWTFCFVLTLFSLYLLALLIWSSMLAKTVSQPSHLKWPTANVRSDRVSPAPPETYVDVPGRTDEWVCRTTWALWFRKKKGRTTQHKRDRRKRSHTVWPLIPSIFFSVTSFQCVHV